MKVRFMDTYGNWWLHDTFPEYYPEEGTIGEMVNEEAVIRDRACPVIRWPDTCSAPGERAMPSAMIEEVRE